MKKVVLIFGLLFSAWIVRGQESALKLGLATYPNFGFIKVEQGKTNGNNLGFTYGLFGDYAFTDNYYLATGLLVTSINGNASIIDYTPYHNAQTSALYDVKLKMRYLEIPVSLKLKTQEVNDLRWFGQFGFTLGARIASKQDVELNNNIIAADASANKSTGFFRAGLLVGAGAEYKVFGKSSLVGGLSYNNGLSNIAKKGSQIKNHYLAINLGFLF